MTTTLPLIISDTDYPDSDGLPMAESDVARNYLVYGVEALNFYFRIKPRFMFRAIYLFITKKATRKRSLLPMFLSFLGLKKRKDVPIKSGKKRIKFLILC